MYLGNGSGMTNMAVHLRPYMHVDGVSPISPRGVPRSFTILESQPIHTERKQDE
jgi:hypothetical protein